MLDLVESCKMAGRTLLANRLRTTLTTLGIIIGNASVIAMVGVGEGAKSYASSQLQSLGTDVIFVIAGSDNSRRNILTPPNRLVLADAEAIAAQVPTVRAVAPEIRSSATVTPSLQAGNTTSKLAQLVGTTPAYAGVRNANTYRGRFFTEMDVKRNARVVAIGCAIAKGLFGEVPTSGNLGAAECKPDSPNPVRFLVDPVGQQVRIQGASYEIIGVMEEKGAFLGTNQDDLVLMPWTTMANRVVGRTSPYGIGVALINVSAVSNSEVEAAKYQIENLLRLRHRTASTAGIADSTFTIRSQRDALSIVGNITNALTILLAATAGISLLVGGIGIMNIMLVSVTERTQEIGLRKAIGAAPRDILLQFAIEAVILSVAGGLVGTVLGAGGVYVVSAFTPLKTGVSGTAVAIAVGASGSIGLFFGIFPARRAAGLDPIVALRSI